MAPLPSVAIRPPTPGERSTDAHTFRTDATTPDVIAAGATPLESYAAFVVARGSDAAIDAVRALGARVDMLPDSSEVRLLTGPVDVRRYDGRPFTTDDRGFATGIVQVYAPFQEAWRTRLEKRGVELLRYIPTNGFLVRGTPEALSGLRALPFVDGVVPFEPSWKIRSGTPVESGLVDLRIVVLPGESVELVASWLAERGVPRVDQAGKGPGLPGAYGSDDFRWLRARMPGNLVRLLAGLPQVEFIEPVRQPRILNAETAWVLQTNVAGNTRYWTWGLNGQGQFIGISDTGLDYDHPQFRHSVASTTVGDIYNVTDPARRKVVRYLNTGVLSGLITWPGGGGRWDPWSIMDCAGAAGHGTLVSSVLAGNDNGIGTSPNDGNALAAKIVMQDLLENSPCAPATFLNPPEDLRELFGPPGLVYHDPDAPVRIHSNSWGADVSDYDIQARTLDAAVWEHPDLLVLFAAGNAGPAAESIGTPATAKNLLAVGGALNPDLSIVFPGDQDDVATLSSRGPTPDGRIKPTILGIFDGDSARSDGDPRSGGGLTDLHWGGTSYSTPSAAATAAIVRQYFTEGWYPTAARVVGNARLPSAALLRAMLIASGAKVTGNYAVRTGQDTWPNNEQGFGRIQLSNVLPIAAAGDTFRTQVIDDQAGLLTGDEATQGFQVTGTRTLKFVLAWSDFPAALGAARALVNDLDLIVTAPDGTVYRGNNFGTFAQGQSVPGGTPDSRNVEEAVIVASPAAGEWTVRIVGSNVPVGPQPFALVVTGDLDAAYGRVTLDRSTYRPGGTINITVEDADATSVQVRVTSVFDGIGEPVALSRGAPGEAWRGSTAASFGPANASGVQVRHGDILRVEYVDTSPSHTAVATARVDAVGPSIFDVSADSPGPSSVRVRWRTDEPATSLVAYGIAPTNLSTSVEDRDLRTSHDLVLVGLQADTLYYYDVVSEDRHDLATRDTRDGRHHRFRTDMYRDVLLVIADDSFPSTRETSWTNALESNDWTWSVWRSAEAGPPPLDVLRAYRAVLWQTGLEQYPPFDASERSLIQSYLDGGGRLLVTSHDTTWALSDPTSLYSGSASEAWVRGVLRSGLDCDPRTVGRVEGVAGDPITGPFAGGVGYTAHRDGGAVDELITLQVGGATTTVWTDDLVSPNNCGRRPVGLRWVSSAPNGTAGTGVWGGTPSRLVYFAFEVTGVDTSPARAQIVDNAVRWLLSASTSVLDRDHPDIAITSPNGGVFASPTISVNWTAASPDASLASIAVSYSGDGGQTWTPLETVLGAARTYTWDVSSLPNGDRYLVRVTARDTGSPSLEGRDESDGFLTIRGPAGDTAGPGIWAGSVRVSPYPPGAGRATWIQATADDRFSGGAAIVGAEFFLASAEPAPTDNGSGVPMAAADGAFDGPVENVSWLDLFPLAEGPACAWVHGRDTAGNWGPYASACFDAIDVGGPDVTPPSITLTDPAAGGDVSGTIRVNATASDDEAVRRVDLRVDGALVATDAAAPYSFLLDTRNFTDGEHAVQAIAFDLAGNSATDEVVVTFVNDRGPRPEPFPLGAAIAAIAIVAVVTGALLLAYIQKSRSRPPGPGGPPPGGGGPPPGSPGGSMRP